MPHDLAALTTSPKLDLVAIEHGVLDLWREDQTFQASLDQRKHDARNDEYVFYDGPPFANGLPHYGHLITGFVKDAIPRYRTMRGCYVDRVFGWDCHGLPVEMQAQKELGVAGRLEILDYGIERFNEYCRESVQRYTDEWRWYVERQGRWVDFERGYRTMDHDYMESVLWTFSTLHEKGLLYEGLRVLPYCIDCETPLSNFETRLDNSYRPRIDRTVTVRLALREPLLGHDADLLIWTTTPWTLPSNLAVAAGPDMRYLLLETDGRAVVLGEAARERYPQLADARVLAELGGDQLVGQTYEPLFDFFADTANAFRVLGGDFVTIEEGTGLVHVAPGFGEDDTRIAGEHDIPVIAPVDSRGRFTSEVPTYEGKTIFEATDQVADDLGRRGVVLHDEQYEHNYPHCWRTDTPLIYKAVTSWFVDVTAIRDRALELNEQIDWVPARVKNGAFGSWLSGARDWSITRNRFWGCPIPVWKSDDPAHPRVDVYGSLDEIERDFGVRPANLHRPYIDELTRPNPDDPTGKATMRRVEDVLDCWFESGSMPFAQVHYPFERREWFDTHNPADFIVEYVGQARSWFYNLHVIATALFDRPAFKTSVAHGIILGNDGLKLSKRLRNYPDPKEMFERYGADAMRWFLLSSPVLRGDDLIVREEGMVEALRRAINPIWNAWTFLRIYRDADGVEARLHTDPSDDLDRYVLAKLRLALGDVEQALDAGVIADACLAVEGFVEVLNNWWIRRSRPRVWRTERDDDQIAALNTLHTALHFLLRAVAPLMPFLSEAIFRQLTSERSVHLSDWPDGSLLPVDAELVEEMDAVREICSAVASLRKERRLRVRLPLARVTIHTPLADRLRRHSQLIAEETNVKAVELTCDVPELVEHQLVLAPRVLGPRAGREMQSLVQAARDGRWEQTEDGVILAGRQLADDEYELVLRARDDEAIRDLRLISGLVHLDTAVTPALEREGMVRDLVRAVQTARKNADLEITDRIELRIDAPEPVREAIDEWQQYLAGQVLADRVSHESLSADGEQVQVAGHRLRIALTASARS